MKTKIPNKKEFLDALMGNYKTWKLKDFNKLSKVKIIYNSWMDENFKFSFEII